MKTNLISNQQFKGYNNICSVADVPVGNLRASYIAFHLNNEGTNDLERYNELRKKQGYVHDFQNKDVVVLTYLKDTKKNTDYLFLGDKSMFWGDELLQLKEKYVPQGMLEEKYNEIEKIHLQAYTFLANLTKRIMNEKFANEDKDFGKVIKEMQNTFFNIRINKNAVFSASDAFRLIEIGCLKRFNFQAVSEAMNKGIFRTMEHFFR